jgi:hypothetical protein
MQKSGNGFEALPTGYIQEVIVLGIDGTCDRVIGCNSCHGLIGILPFFPFNTDIVGGSFPHWMILGKGTFMSCNSLEPPYTMPFSSAFQTGYIQEVVVLGIDGTCDSVNSCNSCHGLIGNLPVFPFNTDIAGGSLLHWMILAKGAFMSCNSLQPPYNGIHNLVVCHDLLILVIVD